MNIDPRDPLRTVEPHDRLTRIGNAMLDTMHAHPEYGPDVRVVLLIDDDDYGGMAMSGQSDDAETASDMIFHLAALLKVNGKQLSVIPIEALGEG